MDSLSPFLLQALLCVHFSCSSSFYLSRAEKPSPFCPFWSEIFSCVWWLSPCFEGADCSRRSTWHKVQLEEKAEQEQRGHIRAQSLFCRRLGKRSRIWTQFCPTESRKKKSRWDGEQSPRGATRGILTSTVVSSALAGNTVKLTQMISVMQNFSSSTDQGLKGKYEYHLNNERA